MSNRRNARDMADEERQFNEARYRSTEGWDGIPTAAIRKAMIAAFRMCGFKKILAQFPIYVLPDGFDADQVPLVRIYGEPVKQVDMEAIGGYRYFTVRAAYHDWNAKVRIRWEDHYTLDDITNMLTRAGYQIGLGESAGMGWGRFELEQHPQHAK